MDELVDGLVSRLEESGLIDNTYIIYTSDNGYHIGQHRLPPGKTCGFEEDIRVPLFIRGPGVAAGGEEEAVTTHIDLAPTIFDLASIPLRKDFDGTPILVTKNSAGARHEHVTVEFWGVGLGEGEKGAVGKISHSSPSVLTAFGWAANGLSSTAPGALPTFVNNTYKSVRILGEDYNLYYSVWCNNEHELYDLNVSGSISDGTFSELT